jgi:hypothetical protein
MSYDKRPTENQTNFTEAEMITGMCLWEAWLELIVDRPAPMDEVYKTAIEMQDGNGAFAMRSVMLALVKDCDTAWEAADQLHEQGSFDWDWCPSFVRGSLKSGRLAELVEKRA